jgi:hypothetical protein
MPRYNPNTGQLTTYQTGPYDSAHIYVQWGGKLPGPETWSCGVRMAGPSATAVADAATLLDDYAGAVSAYHARVGTGLCATAKLSWVKVNAIGTDGKYMVPTTNEQIMADVPGTYSTAQLFPNQVAYAVSLKTAVSRGPAHRGRFFLPAPGGALDANGLVSDTYRDGVRTSTDTFIAAMNAATPGWQMAIFSRKAGAPTHREVTTSEVGRVLDTQRRRRRSLAESYE